ncbi:ATP-binding protein [Terracoccus luteus]|uniref:Orc1-like AAA ATPase domain-containing protein n=1 Tax=Terracoccus luteus TaxID=53356 RepID=A0A839Q2Y8_9MICO|nr:AAA family ATPase [Terracoccus luteus]MBB2987482.1 hypothetical protein [Terracoccus luteus]MCP2173133.1 hypothetical protein [Terracoccus luteus]
MPSRPALLVGRDDDRARLADALGLAGPTTGTGTSSTRTNLETARGGVAVLSGDAGIGKTRLVAAIVEDADATGWRTGVGHCVGQAGSALAYLPFVELVGALAEQAPGVAAATLGAHPALAHLLPRQDRTAGGARGSGVTTPGSGDPDEPPLPTAPPAPGRVAEAVHAFLSALGRDRPTLVVVEDVHWADHSSRDLITLLLTRGFAGPLALVVTYRSDDLHRRHPLHETLAVWARIAGVEHVELAPLPDDAVADIVAGSADVDRETGAEVVRRAGGNPFFAEELAANAAAGRALGGGVSRVLGARIDALDDDARLVVRVVALAGHRVGHDLLSRVSALPDDRLDRAVAAAVEHHVLVTAWPPAYGFRHALLAEAVADGLLPGERLRLHRSFVAVLTSEPGTAPASEVARHAAAVGDLDTAVDAALAAAESAMAVGGPQDALGHLEQALQWLRPDDPRRDGVTRRASDAATLAGDPLRGIELLRDRLDHPDGQSDPDRADLLAALATRARNLDVPLEGLPLTRQAVALLDGAPDERRVRVLSAHLQALVDADEFSEAAGVADEVVELAAGLGLTMALTEVRTIIAWAIDARHDLGAVERHLHTVAADLAPDDPTQLRVHHQLGSVLHRRGELRASQHESTSVPPSPTACTATGPRGVRSAASSAASSPTSSASGTTRRAVCSPHPTRRSRVARSSGRPPSPSTPVAVSPRLRACSTSCGRGGTSTGCARCSASRPASTSSARRMPGPPSRSPVTVSPCSSRSGATTSTRRFASPRCWPARCPRRSTGCPPSRCARPWPRSTT